MLSIVVYFHIIQDEDITSKKLLLRTSVIECYGKFIEVNPKPNSFNSPSCYLDIDYIRRILTHKYENSNILHIINPDYIRSF